MDLKQEIEALDRIASTSVYDVEAAMERYTHLWLYGGTAEQVREAHQLAVQRGGASMNDTPTGLESTYTMPRPVRAIVKIGGRELRAAPSAGYIELLVQDLEKSQDVFDALYDALKDANFGIPTHRVFGTKPKATPRPQRIVLSVPAIGGGCAAINPCPRGPEPRKGRRR